MNNPKKQVSGKSGAPQKTKKTTKCQTESKKILVNALIVSLLVSCVVGAIFGFLAGGINQGKGLAFLKENVLNQKVEEGKNAKKNNLSLVEEDSAVVNLVEKTSPAVVSIIITKDVPKLNSFFLNPFSNDPFFNSFGSGQNEQDNQNDSGSDSNKVEVGGGTGFIVDSEGYVITNRHVVSDQTADYTVMMNDGEKIEAKVLAKDNFGDIAVLKIESEKKLPTVKLGNSENLKIGQTTVAIGNSLGEFRNTVSKGIISGLKREVEAGNGYGQSETLEEVIQTDAAINPGNSGGPLLDLKGQVIGVNVAMAQGAENIGFAIPINQVKRVYESVKENGKISYPYLGVRYAVLNKQIQKENNLNFDYGALIVRGQKNTDLAIIPGSPADKAGLVENDIILEIDGKKIQKDNDLAKIIRSKNVGDTLTLKVWSKGDTKTVKVTLEEAKS
jgi:serine protease Do